MANKYVIKISGWPDHVHEVVAHTEPELREKLDALVHDSHAGGVDLHPQGARHDGMAHHYQGTNENGHPRELKIMATE